VLYQKTEKRIDQILAILEERSYTCCENARFSNWYSASTGQVYGEEIPDLDFKKIEFPFSYGESWVNWWFASTFTLPNSNENFFLELKTETDSMVFLDANCVGATNPFHTKLNVTEYAGKETSLHIEAWAGHLFPGYHPSEGGRVLTTVSMRKKAYPLVFETPRILQRQEDTYALYYDVLTLRQLCKTLAKDSYQYQTIMAGMHSALMAIDLFGSNASLWRDQVCTARNLIKPLLESKNGTLAPQVYSVGSAHLDHAWLWPIEETTRKAARTSLNMVNFTKEYPDFKFLFSQPAQMVALKKRYPSVFKKVQQAYRTGSWEPNGIGYVEPDCVLTSGESLIRQCLKGREKTAELFDGYQGDVFWLPDSFGYTAALPQILVGCGATYFVTSKLSWNDTNRFPYDLFEWESLNGTRIKSHMIQGAYEGTNDPVELKAAYDSIVHKDLQNILMRSVGEGDGGGGTTRSDLELMKREHNLQGLPMNRWTTLSESMDEIFKGRENLPVYRGELYLELHRGTYTSQSRLKRYNRKLEGMLHSAEYLSALQFCRGENCTKILQTIDEAWEIVLINQFHDILPGSSIRRVNEEAEASYAKAVSLLTPLLKALQGPLVLNPNGFPFPLPDGTAIEPYQTRARFPIVSDKKVCCKILVTNWCEIVLDEQGGITSLLLISDGRQLVEKGKVLNTLTLGEDYPINWDAWDIESDSLKKKKRISEIKKFEMSENEYSYTVKQTFILGEDSFLEQEMKIFKEITRIDFDNWVTWKERHRILRVEFPTTVRSDNAFYDVPFGYISRNNSMNTSFDRAKFEVPAHKWAALSDCELSVALASDSKYGYMAEGGTLSLSLLRSPTAPDPEADQGEHRFLYSFIVSTDGLKSVMAHSTAINNPLVSIDSISEPLCNVIQSSVVIETVKVSAKKDRLVFRLREPFGIPQKCKLVFSPLLDAESIQTTDMLENPIKQGFDCAFNPFDVITFTVALSNF
jgi:alpha-mannosidase